MHDSAYRDVTAWGDPARRETEGGKAYIAVIGIDHYRSWGRLHNAVNDARGALNLFVRHGFEPVGAPLIDDTATGAALHRLVTNDLQVVGKQDSLIVFFAGHGHTVIRTFFDGTSVKDGYLIPSDG